MLLPKFDFHEPATIEEACQILAELKSEARLLSGGTDLLVNMKKKLLAPRHVVSVSRLDELLAVSLVNGATRLGARLTAAEIAVSEPIGLRFSALGAGAASLGSPLIRNLATLGGNLVTARPAADLPPPLLAYGARVVLRRASGERTVALDDFFQGPGETVVAPDELLTEILLDNPPPLTGGGYCKIGVRNTLEISLVNVAARITLEDGDGPIRSARIVLGAVAPTPIRARAAEEALIGERPSEALFSKAAQAAARDSRPIDDHRASAEYRRAMAAVLTRRALQAAHADATQN